MCVCYVCVCKVRSTVKTHTTFQLSLPLNILQLPCATKGFHVHISESGLYTTVGTTQKQALFSYYLSCDVIQHRATYTQSTGTRIAHTHKHTQSDILQPFEQKPRSFPWQPARVSLVYTNLCVHTHAIFFHLPSTKGTCTPTSYTHVSRVYKLKF